MKKFRVKLIEGHAAHKTQNVKGYLGDVKEGIAMRYTRGEAIKKAAAFKGKIEPVKTSVGFVEMKIAQIVKNTLTPALRELLYIPEFRDTNESSGETIYIADVFANILKVNKKKLDEESMLQLEELVNEMWNFDYVLFV